MARYLLDTHIFIWINQDSNKIPTSIKEILTSTKDDFYLSMASIWEMQIKIQLGKLVLNHSLDKILKDIEHDKSFKFLPINKSHILNLQHLPFIHKDPFDRLLISQAMTENLTLLTVDENIVKYPSILFVNN